MDGDVAARSGDVGLMDARQQLITEARREFAAENFDEARLLNAGHRFQQSTDWHRRSAPGIA